MYILTCIKTPAPAQRPRPRPVFPMEDHYLAAAAAAAWLVQLPRLKAAAKGEEE